MSIRERWRAWRCHRGRHDWAKAHDAIWNGGYMRCGHCGRREVHGGDCYGPAAMAWIAHAIPPPARGMFYTADEWREWNKRVRNGGDR